MDDELVEVIHEFIVESRDGMDELDRDLVSLEQDASDEELARIFRAIHTVKGTSGFLGYARLEAVTHVGESLLSRLRDGSLSVDTDITTALLSMVDAVRSILDSIEAVGDEGTRDDRALIATLARLEAGGAATGALDERVACEATVETGSATDGDATARSVASAADEPGPMCAAGHPHDAPGAAPHDDRTSSSESIRVDVGLLDDLMNLVGELVLARNQILQHGSTDRDTAFVATTQRLDLITTELQAGVMRTRMQAIENVWNKFPRVVRDLSLACGKQARLEMEGKHTELDKSLLESIKDPLTHLVRNCVDHGLESPEGREAAGKAAEGIVRLGAYHEGGQVIVEIGDDGRGIDPAAIRRAAVEKGLSSAEEAADRSDQQILDVIFEPGFSTAAAVTNISGRGVGMDVVRTNIESIGGTVDVSSSVGVGTVFKIKIPLTLAIIPALVITCDGDRFAIPQVNLRELVRIGGHDPYAAIEHVHGAPVHRLRGRLLPLVDLRAVFGQPPLGETAVAEAGITIVVLHADGREFGLVVDDIEDTAEIVVKPLGRTLRDASAFAGATIMGDGRVALILDVLGIAHAIGMGSTAGRPALEVADDPAAAATQRVLMFRLGDRPLGLLLATVSRLEEFDPTSVERTVTRDVVQYRDRIMNLIDLHDTLGIPSAREPDDPLQVIVCSADGHDVGLVVDDIFDIVEEQIDLAAPSPAAGILSSSIIAGRVTDVIDVDAVLRSCVPELFARVVAA
ncbi:chemotaxis protein CheW [Ilumatobacter sp.]|uniref:chemotaxis protein CheW n=1 Tax=Ilumatobacter sp. TaxID=1967498 RepID=UPI003B52F630